MFFYSDDPAMDLIRYQDWQGSCGDDDDEDEGVKCYECGDALDRYCYDPDGEYICEECFDDAYKVELNSDEVCDECRQIIYEDIAYHIDGLFFHESCAKKIYRCHTPEKD